MKKTVLAMAITAALVGLGFAGACTATVVPRVNASLSPAIATVQKVDQSTLGVVQVDFRSSTKSADVFDFQVFLSPGDVWSVNTPLTSGAAGIRVFKDT